MRGRSAARDATVMPVPSSMVDHMASLDVLSKKYPVVVVMPATYLMRTMEAMEPLM
jgi:hypothetical protein